MRFCLRNLGYASNLSDFAIVGAAVVIYSVIQLQVKARQALNVLIPSHNLLISVSSFLYCCAVFIR